MLWDDFPRLTHTIVYNKQMTDGSNSTMTNALRKILRPLVRILLRNGVAYADFTTLVRQTFVDVAGEDFDLPGRKQSVSRISVLTGINRKEVKRLMEEPRDAQPAAEHNRAARVVSGWMRDASFQNKKGKPSPLSWGDSSANDGFEALVKKYSGDMPARSVLDELIRVGAVELESNRRVRLAATGYVPAASNEELLRLSGEGVTDLLNTVDHNINDNKSHTRLQLSVAYDDVPANGVEMFRNLSREKSLELLTYLDGFLATQDRSVNPSVQGDGRYRTGIGIYYFEEPVQNSDNPEAPDSATVAAPDTDALKAKGGKK